MMDMASPWSAHGERVLEDVQGDGGEKSVPTNYIGAGYHGTHTPPVILRNILDEPRLVHPVPQLQESQGRLESLLNFQTMITDLTGMPLSNSSLLDEGTAAAEAMTMCSALNRGKKPKFQSRQVPPANHRDCEDSRRRFGSRGHRRG